MKGSSLILTVVILVLFAIHQVLISKKMKAKDDRIEALETQVKEFEFSIHMDSVIKANTHTFEGKLDSSYLKLMTK